jgi:polyribonucleotide 5'-hydroxyl-kinase
LSSGIILKTTGWIDGPGYDLLLEAIQLFSIDIVIVIGHDRLYSLLSSFAVASSSTDPSSPSLTVVKLPKSGGTVSRNESDRRRLRRGKITEYFYGKRSPGDLLSSLTSLASSSSAALSLQSQIDSLPNRFSPSRIDLSLKNYTLLKPGGLQLPQSMMPLGQTEKKTQMNELKLVPTSLSIDMEHTVIGVLHGLNTIHSGREGDRERDRERMAETISNEEMNQKLSNMNVAGFICVVKIDIEHEILTVLSPCSGHLPSTNLFVGSIKWVE